MLKSRQATATTFGNRMGSGNTRTGQTRSFQVSRLHHQWICVRLVSRLLGSVYSYIYTYLYKLYKSINLYIYIVEMCYSDNWGNPDLFTLICGRPRYRDVALFRSGGLSIRRSYEGSTMGFTPVVGPFSWREQVNASRNWCSIQLQYISNHPKSTIRFFRAIAESGGLKLCQLPDGCDIGNYLGN